MNYCLTLYIEFDLITSLVMSTLLGIWVLMCCNHPGPFGKGDEPYRSWVYFLLLPLQKIASKPYTGLLLPLILTPFSQLLANLHHHLLLHPPGIYLGQVILSIGNASPGVRYLRCMLSTEFSWVLSRRPFVLIPHPLEV